MVGVNKVPNADPAPNTGARHQPTDQTYNQRQTTNVFEVIGNSTATKSPFQKCTQFPTYRSPFIPQLLNPKHNKEAAVLYRLRACLIWQVV
jgi:hypothetical protein